MFSEIEKHRDAAHWAAIEALMAGNWVDAMKYREREIACDVVIELLGGHPKGEEPHWK